MSHFYIGALRGIMTLTFCFASFDSELHRQLHIINGIIVANVIFPSNFSQKQFCTGALQDNAP